MYNVNYKFREKDLPTGDQIRLTISFIIDAEGYTTDLVAEEVGTYMTDELSCEWDYDIDKGLLVPGNCNIKLSCIGSDFDKYIFETAYPFSKTNRRGMVKLEIRPKDTSEWKTRFNGWILEDTVRNIPDTTYISFTALPRTEILNRAKLSQTSIPNSYISFREALYRIFWYVDSNITENDVTINHHWIVKAQLHDFHNYLFPITGNLSFEDLRINLHDYASLLGLETLGDILRRLAFDFFSIIGISNNGKIFMKSFNCFSYTNSAEYSFDERRKYENKYKQKFIDFVTISERDVPNGTTVHGVGPVTGHTYTEGTEFIGANSIEKGLCFWFYEGVIGKGGQTYTAYQSNLKANINGSLGDVITVKDELLSTNYIHLGSLLAKNWHNLKRSQENERNDFFEMPGINYDYNKGFSINNKIYNILTLREYYFRSISEIEALFVRDV